MKKLISTLVLFFIAFSSVSAANTSSSEIAKNKLSKQVTLTTEQVKKDFGEEYIVALDKYFNFIRYYKDKESLKELNTILEPLILKYSQKNSLNVSERKTYILLQNMYYRSTLISNYYSN